MNEIAHRLALAYRRQLELYDEVLELARDGVRRVREGRPLHELHAINETKARRLAEIEAVDRAVRLDKETWLRTGRPRGGTDLDRLLGKLTERIEDILYFERETDRALIEASGVAAESALGASR